MFESAIWTYNSDPRIKICSRKYEAKLKSAGMPWIMDNPLLLR